MKNDYKIVWLAFNCKLSGLVNILILITAFGLPFLAKSQPVVVTQPQDTSVCVETSAGFGIIAVNTSGYQWQENDGIGWYDLNSTFTYVSGEYTPNLTINDANLALNGYLYRCIVNDINNDRDTSSPATLGVYEPPIFLSEPVNQRVCKSDIAVFSVEVINGTSYQWQEYNGVGWLNIENNSFYEGAQSPDLSVYTVTGMDGFSYHCIVKNVSCPDTSGMGTLNVDPTPVLFAITGGGEYCDGGSGVSIGLNGSEMGISYNLLRDGIETGVVKEGTGQSLDFGLQILEGIYTVVGYNQFTSCSIDMGGVASIIINPLPEDIAVLGGGTICNGEDFPEVYMLTSEIGVSYSLYRNAQATGITIAGTGIGINFGPQSSSGVFSIIAENNSTGCYLQLSGTVEIEILDLPIANAGEDHTIVQGNYTQLQGSASGGSGVYDYLWMPSSLCVSPTTPATQTNILYASTIFKLLVTDVESGCESIVDTSIVYVGSGPLSIQAFASNNNICSGESINLIAVAGGGTGSYSYTWTSSPPGFVSTSPTTSVTPLVSGLYIVTVSDGLEVAIDTVSINVFDLPQAFTISNGGSYCSGGQGVDILLNGSETGIKYLLYYQQSVISDMVGTGQQLNFTNNTQHGDYNIVARNETTGCSMPQSGIANVGVFELPIAEAGPNTLINAGSLATLDGSASGGSGGYSYSWTPSDSLVNPTSPTPSTIPLNNTNMFKLTVSDNNGCSSQEDNTIVFVTGGQISLEILTSGYPVCSEEEVQLYAMASGGSGSFSYFWQSNPVGFSSTLYNPIVFPTQTTTYIVTVNDGLSVVTDSVTVIVNPSPIAYTLSGGGVVCQGTDPSNIVLQGSEIGIDYYLLKDGTYSGMTISGTGFALDFGTYSENGMFTAYAKNFSTQCETDMIGDAVIVINPLPVSNAGPDQLIVAGSNTTLSGTATGGSGSYSYQWQPSYLCVSPLSQNTLTQPISQSTLFSLSISDLQSQCISAPDTVFVYTNGSDLYTNATAVPTPVCSGNEVVLSSFTGGGTGNYTYSWTSSPAGFYSSYYVESTYPNVSTYYFLDVFDGINHAYDTIFVEVLPLPIIYQMTGGGDYCEGGAGLSIGLSGSEIGASYSLYRNPNELITEVIGVGQPIDFGVYKQSGTYYATSVVNSYCEETMLGESVIVVNQNPISIAGEDQTISYNSQTVLDGSGQLGSGSYNFSWTPMDSLVNPNSQQPLTNPLGETTMFNLFVTDNITGCESSEDNTIVFVTGGQFNLQLVSSDPILCPGDESQLFALVSGGSGNYSYLWTSNPSGFVSTSYNPSVDPNQTTTYIAIVSDGISTLTDSITITVNPLPISYTLSGGGIVCEGDDPSNIVLQGSEVGVDYQLLNNGQNTGLTNAGTGFSIDFGMWLNNGNYTVFATNYSTLCENDMLGEAVVTINPLPIAFAGPDQLIASASSTTLSGNASGGMGSYIYQWEPSYLCISPNNQNTLTQPISQSTFFNLVVSDIESQCVSAADTMFVLTQGSGLYVIASSSPSVLCSGEQLNLSSIAGGGTGNYSFSWSSIPSGYSSTNSSSISFPLVNTTYVIEVFDGVSYVYDSIYIEVMTMPTTFSITGGGNYCDGGDGVSIGLSGSEIGSDYTLFRSPGESLYQMSGTGQILDFGLFTQSGTYYVVANSSGNCQQTMNENAIIQIDLNPIALAGEDQTITYNSQTIITGNAQSGSGNYSYLWSPSDSLINNNIQLPLTIPLHNTTMFDLVVTDITSGCISEADNSVVFVSGGAFSLQLTSSDPTICQSEETQLFALATGGSGNYTYLWTSSPPGFTSSAYNPVVSPTVSTIYTVLVNDGNSIISEQISISVVPRPLSFSLLGGGEVCFGQQSDEITLQSSELNTDYTLLRDGISTNIIKLGTGFPLNFGSQSQEGQYSVFALENSSQCSNYMASQVNVIINQLPLANAGIDKIIVSNSTTTLSGQVIGGSGSYLYNWEPNVLCQQPNNATTETNSISQTTLFKFKGIDNQTQCESAYDTVFVYTTGSDLSVIASASSYSICNGESLSLLALPDGGSGNYSYTWTSSVGSFNSSLMNPIIQPETSMMYYVELFDGLNYAFDSTYVQVLQNPNIYTVAGGGNYCQGGNGVEIYLDNSDQGVLYRLYHFPDSPVSDVIGDGSEILFGEFVNQGDYYVVANPENSCYLQMNGTVTVGINQLPISNAGDDKIMPWMNQTILNGSAIGGSGYYGYSWTPFDSLINPTNQEPLTIPLHSTTLFDLVVNDAQTGCIGNTDQMVVYVSGGPLSLDVYSSNTSICMGEQTQLFALASGGSGSYTYLWLSEPPGFSYNDYDPIVEPDESTLYKVIINDGTNTIVDSIIINVTASPISYNLFGGGLYCEGSNGVEIMIDNSDETIIYELYNQFGTTGIAIPGSGDTLNFGLQLDEGYYWSIGMDNTMGCYSIMNDTIEVGSVDNPVAFAGNDQYIYQNSSAQLLGSASGGSGFYNFNWFPEYLLNNPLLQNPTTVPLSESTLFTMAVTDDNTGCNSSPDSTIVYITNTELVVSVNASPDVVCEGEEVYLSALPTGGTGNYTYNWYSNPSGFYSNSQFPVNTPLETITYIVEVFDGDSTLIDSVNIEVISSPEIFQIVGGGSYCKNGDGVNISLSGSQENIEYTLLRNQNIEVVTLIGNGLSIDFGEYKIIGSYIVVAGNTETSCYQQMSGSVVVSQYPHPIANAGPDLSIISGGTATLQGSASGGIGPYNYMWTPTEKLLNPSDPDATTVALFNTSMFTLQVSDDITGCQSDPANMIVFIAGGPLNVDVIAESNQVCPGNHISLFALPGGGNGNYSYFWESIPLGFNATSSHINVNPGVSTWYKVTVTDGNQSVKDSLLVNMLPIPNSYDLMGGGGYCNGSGGVDIYMDNTSQNTIYTLFHNAVSTGNYIIGDGLPINFGPILTEGNYSVLAENSEGCSSLMNNVVKVSVDPLPEKYQLYGGGIYCENDPTLGLLLESSQVDVEYELYKDAVATGIIVDGSGLPLSFSGFDGTGNYSVVATGSYSGCTNTMIGVSGLIIYDKPNVNIVGPNNICQGDEIVLSGSGGYSYEWNTLPPDYTPSITVSPEISTLYTLTGYNQNGCSDTANKIIEVGEKPILSLANDQVQLTIICSPDGLYNYEFYIGNELLQKGESNRLYYGDAGQLADTINVIAYTSGGCNDSKSIYVELKDAPNAFTPNGDGVNDRFLEGHYITIYSSWGGEIYKGDQGWDGKFNGSLVTPGTYYYIRHIYNPDGIILKTIKGSVTVVVE